MAERDLPSDVRLRMFQEFVQDRGVDTPCARCGGLGVITYGSTATWHGGVGGQTMTSGVCDSCWGSGDEHNKWPDLRALSGRHADLTAHLQIAVDALEEAEDALGVTLNDWHRTHVLNQESRAHVALALDAARDALRRISEKQGGKR